MKCEECGQEHERLYLGCDKPGCTNRWRAKVFVYREHGRVWAICAKCKAILAFWPDAPNDWKAGKIQ